MNLNSIKLRFSKNQQIYRLSKIDSFDLAIVLKNKTNKVVQCLPEVDSNLLAPEIKEGQPHGFSSDIWALGQVAYQIMSVPRESYRPLRDVYAAYALWLAEVPDDYKQLVGSMINEDPASRPTAAQLLQSPLISQFR